MAHKEALQREIDYINIAVGKYKVGCRCGSCVTSGTDKIQERDDDAVAAEQDNHMESAESSDDPMMIDPALLTPERLGSGSAESSVSGDSVASDHNQQVSKKPASKKLAGRSHITKDLVASNDTSASGRAPAAGTRVPVNGAATPKASATAAMNAATKNLAIVEDDMAIDRPAAVGEASEL